MIAASVTTASKPLSQFLLSPSCFDAAKTACLRRSCHSSGIAGCREASGVGRPGSRHR